MYHLQKHPLFECDLEEAALWYHRRNAGAAERLLQETIRCLHVISSDPLRFARRHRELRHIRLNKFPHSIFYFVEGKTVFAVLLVHDSRDLQEALKNRMDS